MTGRGSGGRAARLLCAAGLGARLPLGLGQTARRRHAATAAATRPSSIRMRRSRRCPTSASTGPTSRPRKSSLPSASRPAAGLPATQQRRATGTSQVRYTLAIEGLTGRRRCRGSAEGLHGAVGARGRRKKPANAAQIARRSRADADLLDAIAAQPGLLRCCRRAAHASAARMAAGGARGRSWRSNIASLRSSFPASRLPGRTPTKLREPSRSRPATRSLPQDVIAGGAALTTALGEQGFAEAKVGEQAVEINHQTRLATLILPVNPGSGRAFRHDPRQRQAAVQRPPRRDHRPVQAGDQFKRSKIDDLRRALIATSLVANRRHQAGPGQRWAHGRCRRCVWSPRPRTRSPASLGTARGRALWSK